MRHLGIRIHSVRNQTCSERSAFSTATTHERADFNSDSHVKTPWWITTKRFSKGDEVKFNAGSGMYYFFVACGDKHPDK